MCSLGYSQPTTLFVTLQTNGSIIEIITLLPSVYTIIYMNVKANLAPTNSNDKIIFFFVLQLPKKYFVCPKNFK